MAPDQKYEHLLVARSGAVATVALNRPEVHNALNAALIGEIDRCFRELGNDPEVRIAILTGEGRSFCAGADVNWQISSVGHSDEENRADAMKLVRMLEAIESCPKPVIARVNGAALGGGAGLVAACDLAIAAETARFSFSEVRLGVVPAMISPFVLRRVGPGTARAYYLLGEQFDAAEALRRGLVFRAVTADALGDEIDKVVQSLLAGSPTAQATIKEMLHALTSGSTPPDAVADYTVAITAERRVSPEGQEGLRAFLERRPPAWAPRREGQS